MLSNQCIHDINRLHALAGPVAEMTSCTLANMRHPGTEVEPTLPSLLQFALSVTEGWPIQAPPEFALRDIETWNAMVLSHLKHEPVQIPVDRDEYAALHADLVAGKHDLHWS